MVSSRVNYIYGVVMLISDTTDFNQDSLLLILKEHIVTGLLSHVLRIKIVFRKSPSNLGIINITLFNTIYQAKKLYFLNS